MADLRAEQILDAIVTNLTGLTTTGTNIVRARVYNHADTALPALSVYMGSDEPEGILSQSVIDWNLTVIIESAAKSSTTQIDQILNLIRKEVHAALFADNTLGLSFVKYIEPGNAIEPELSGDGDKPVAKQRLEFMIHYRTSYSDLSA